MKVVAVHYSAGRPKPCKACDADNIFGICFEHDLERELKRNGELDLLEPEPKDEEVGPETE